MQINAMSETINQCRRGFLGSAANLASGLAASRIGITSAFVPAAPFGPLQQIHAGVLDVGYVEMGPRNGRAVIFLHGWPYDIHSYVEVAPLLAAADYRVIVPYLRGFGTTRFLSQDTVRNGQQAALAQDLVELMNALNIDRAILAGFDWGTRVANVVAAIWPERVKALVATSGYLIVNREHSRLPTSPKLEHGLWYQYYFATERGRAGYAANRRDLAKLVWKNTSPGWSFDDETFDRAATAFDNPDHVDVVVHNYRWRLGLAAGEPQYDAIENYLAQSPVIAAPTISLDGEHDGVLPASDGASYADNFSGKHIHRIVLGAGHNLPQEAPRDFAAAVIDVDRY